jgi:ssRNA-specific RNase YbeY (16S rRNA maturation enzyme)
MYKIFYKIMNLYFCFLMILYNLLEEMIQEINVYIMSTPLHTLNSDYANNNGPTDELSSTKNFRSERRIINSMFYLQYIKY